MDNTPRNDILHPRGEGFLRRSYLVKKVPKVKYLPPAEAVKFMSSARNRCSLGNVKKPNIPGVSTPSCSRNVQIGTMIASSDANVHSLAAKQTWKAHQGSRVSWKPLDIGLKETESCVPNSKPIPSLNDHGRSVDSEQNAGSEIGKEKGEEMTLAKKAEFGIGQKQGKDVSFLRDSCYLGVKPRECRQQNFGWENMADAPANVVMNPRGADATKRKNYIPPKTCKIKYIPPSEAVKLMPGTGRKRRRCDTKKPNNLRGRRNPKAPPPNSQKVGAGSNPPAHAETPSSGSGLANSEPGSAVKGKGGSKLMETAQSGFKVAHAAGEGSAGV